MATSQTAVQEAEELPISVSNRKREEGDLDITPMIDITFLLLIFFLYLRRWIKTLQSICRPPKMA